MIDWATDIRQAELPNATVQITYLCAITCLCRHFGTAPAGDVANMDGYHAHFAMQRVCALCKSPDKVVLSMARFHLRDW
jgi:hypothetical protein